MEAELKDLKATLGNIEGARPFDQLTTGDVLQARPEIAKTIEEMVKKGKWTVPGYDEKFGSMYRDARRPLLTIQVLPCKQLYSLFSGAAGSLLAIVGRAAGRCTGHVIHGPRGVSVGRMADRLSCRPRVVCSVDRLGRLL